MSRSGLIVEVREAEPAVTRWREQLDPHAALGVPPHVTVLFPFAAPDRIDEATTAILSQLVAAVPVFGFRLTRTGWFGDAVLWLAPEPAAPFSQLTASLAATFPDYQPYGGQFIKVVPHLTIGDHAPAQPMADAEREVQRHLPIRATAHAVILLAERSDGRWERLMTFPLGAAR